MPGVPSEMHLLHLFLCWLLTQLMGPCIENGLYLQACLGGGAANQPEDDFIGDERLALPILGNIRK
jgi:hypothetical protein